MKSVVSKNAFTIVELLVAMALVVILVGLSSMIFMTAVKAHRTADSTIEITRRAEVVSRQLVSDVRGLQTDAPLAVWFEKVYVDTDDDGITDTYKHFDQILFFGNGDFQTIRQYGSIVKGNLARIYYGHAWQANVNSAVEPWTWSIRGDGGYTWFSPADTGSGLLSRRVQLLTSDMTLPPMIPYGFRFPSPDIFVSLLTDYNSGQFMPYWNNRLEYDQLSLAEWKNLMQVQDNCEQVLRRSFSRERDANLTGRPMIDMKNVDTLHLLLSGNISEFKVQLAYTKDDTLVPGTFEGVQWWPQTGNAALTSGIYFNMPGNPTETHWQSASDIGFIDDFFPKALKFTFTVHDTKGLFPEGRTFTQIVYINSQ